MQLRLALLSSQHIAELSNSTLLHQFLLTALRGHSGQRCQANKLTNKIKGKENTPSKYLLNTVPHLTVIAHAATYIVMCSWYSFGVIWQYASWSSRLTLHANGDFTTAPHHFTALTCCSILLYDRDRHSDKNPHISSAIREENSKSEVFFNCFVCFSKKSNLSNLGINYEFLSSCNDAMEHNEPKRCGWDKVERL